MTPTPPPSQPGCRNQFQARPGRHRSIVKGALFGLVLIVMAVALHQYGGALSLQSIASKEEALRTLKQSSPLAVTLTALGIYVAATGLSLPGAAGLSLVYGWFFGFGPGLVIVSIASTAGATLAFLFSRFLLRDWVEARFGERLRGFNEALEREGVFYLFTMRLIPAIPFVVINLVMGLTPMRSGTFWWVSQVGMLPGTAVFVYAGSQFPSLAQLAEKGASGLLTPKLIGAFVLLGIFPLIAKKTLAAFRQSHSVR